MFSSFWLHFWLRRIRGLLARHIIFGQMVQQRVAKMPVQPVGRYRWDAFKQFTQVLLVFRKVFLDLIEVLFACYWEKVLVPWATIAFDIRQLLFYRNHVLLKPANLIFSLNAHIEQFSVDLFFANCALF